MGEKGILITDAWQIGFKEDVDDDVGKGDGHSGIYEVRVLYTTLQLVKKTP